MRVLLQRVLHADVQVAGEMVGKIGKGLLLLVGFCHADEEPSLELLASKVVHLRIFEDEQGKMNRSILEEQGELLVISQFTLYANTQKGRRPSFTQSMHPEKAEAMYELWIEKLQKSGLKVEKGIFGADMQVSLCNDGPVTMMLEDPLVI